MKSNRQLFNKTVFKSNFLRFLPFVAPLLIAELILFPVSIISRITSSLYEGSRTMTLAAFATQSLQADCFVFVAAGMLALLMFSYLFKAKHCIMFHAFPVGRKSLFFTGFLSGYLLLILPQLIAFGVAIPLLARVAVAADFGNMIALQLFSIFANSFIAYATGILAAVLAGNFFTGAVLYAVINGFFSALISVLNVCVDILGCGMNYEDVFDYGIHYHLSPATMLFRQKTILSATGYEKVMIYQENITTVFSRYFYLDGIYMVAACVILIAALLLYRKRPLECAGDMVAFKIETPVLSILAAVLGGATASVFIQGFFEFNSRSFFSITYIIFGAIAFFGTLMILEKSARVFQAKRWLWLAITLAVSISATVGISAYQTDFIPKSNTVAAATVEDSYTAEIAPENMAKLQKLHALLIENEKERSANAGQTANATDENFENHIYLTYTLKNKKTVKRDYGFNSKQRQDITALISELELGAPPKTIFDEIKDVDFEIQYCDIRSNNDTAEFIRLHDAKELDESYALCREDLKARTTDYTTEKIRKSIEAEADNTSLPYSITFYCLCKTDEDAKKINPYFDENNISDIVCKNDVNNTQLEVNLPDEDIDEYYSFRYKPNPRRFSVTIDKLQKDSAAQKFFEEKFKK